MFTINSYYDIYKSIGPSYQDKRKGIVLIARQHPGETVGSYVMQGCIDFLMGNSDEAKKLRDIYIIKVVPMMNPDGVLVGNSRTSFAGCDLNRRWLKPNEIIHPEVYYTKEMILKLASQREIAFICDFHGHFGAFNSFFIVIIKIIEDYVHYFLLFVVNYQKLFLINNVIMVCQNLNILLRELLYLMN